MATSYRYKVIWTMRQGDVTVQRSISSQNPDAAIETARLIDNNPYTKLIRVIDIRSGSDIEWKATRIGRVIVDEEFEKAAARS